ncbi:MAG: hypothetical protein GSR79_05305 [Desulfurococcales archaeon]|nr:hypothetical protein [Desulfurococcales archaeon]
MRRSVPIILLILSVAGASIAAFYIWSHQSGNDIGYCTQAPGSPGPTACETAYSLGWLSIPLIGRVHLSWIALAFFSLQAFLALIYIHDESRRILNTVIALYAIGIVLIPYLAYMQLEELSSICLYCASMYVVIILALITGLYERRSRGPVPVH